MGMNSLRLRASIPSFNNTTVVTSGFDVTNHASVGLQLVLTGTSITGSARLQISEDGVTWGDVASSSQNYTAAGSIFWGIPVYNSKVRISVISGDTDAVVGEVYGVAKEF